MTPIQFQRINQIVEEALDLPANERPAFLDKVCAGDSALRAEVESLLDHAPVVPDTFLEVPALNLLPGNDTASEEPNGSDELAKTRDQVRAGDNGNDFAGKTLGKYQMLEKIGQGGMGEVYRAKHLYLKRTVAVKVLPPHLLGNEQAVSRFRREVEAAGRLDHLHVVRTFDADEADGRHFLVMEWLDGQDLAKWLRAKGPLPVAEICDCMRQAGLGLDYAHRQGMVHRDVKPSNLLLTKSEDGTPLVKVLDLGLALLHDATPTDGELTSTGQVMGTFDFIAPEQALETHSVDARADIYSLGCTFYFLLTGKLPLPGKSEAKKLLAHQLEEPIPMTDHRTDIPSAVVAVVAKMMSKDPAQRFQSMQELADTLLRVLAQVLQPRGTVPVRKRPIMIGATVLLAAAALAVFLFWGRESPGPEQANKVSPNETPVAAVNESPFDKLDANMIPASEKFDWQPKELVAVLGEHHQRHWGDVLSLAYSPDGKYLVSGGMDESIRVWEADTLKEVEVRKYPGVGGIFAVAFDADSKAVAFAGDNGICYVSDFQKGKLKTIAELPIGLGQMRAVAIAPGGKVLAAVSIQSSAIFLWDLNDKNAAPLKVAGHTGGVWALAFSPDGKLLASGSADKTFRIWDVKGTQLTELALMRDQAELREIAFSSDGKTLATSSTDATCLWDLQGKKIEKRQEWKGRHHVAFAARVNFVAAGLEASFAGVTVWSIGQSKVEEWAKLDIEEEHGPVLALSPDGKRLAMGLFYIGLVQTWDTSRRTPKERHPIRPDKCYGAGSFKTRLDVSADGRMLACAGLDGRIQLWELAGATPRLQRIVGKYCGHSLALSPTGSQLAAVEGDLVQLWNLDAAKEATARTLRNSPYNFVAFSRDGSVLASMSQRSLALWNSSGITPTEKTDLNIDESRLSHPTLSADGLFLAATAEYDPDVRLYDVSQAEPQKLPHLKHENMVWSLAFSPRSRLLACGSVGFIQLWDLNRAEAKKLARWSINSPGWSQVFSVAFSPDGDRLASAHHDGQLIVWDLATGKQVWQRQLPGEIHKLLFAPDGRHLITLNGNGTIYIFRLEGPRAPLQNAG